MDVDSVRTTLNNGLNLLPFEVSDPQRQQFLTYLECLNTWNKVHNLTAVRDPQAQIARHILDSLVVLPHVSAATSIADIGSGAGLPALMLAIMRPEMPIYAVESSGKKAAFIRSTALRLGLERVTVVNQRVENWHPPTLDVIISRALASAEQFVRLTAHLGDDHSRWLIMKGREDESFAVAGFVVAESYALQVPLLAEQRKLLDIQKDRR